MKENNNSAIIGERLISVRKLNNLSIEEISDYFGIDPKLWAAYEKGLYTPDFRLILSVSHILNISPSYLFGQSDDITKPSTLLGDLSEEQLLEKKVWLAFCDFLDALNNLTEENKAKILTHIKNMTDDSITK